MRTYTSAKASFTYDGLCRCFRFVSWSFIMMMFSDVFHPDQTTQLIRAVVMLSYGALLLLLLLLDDVTE